MYYVQLAYCICIQALYTNVHLYVCVYALLLFLHNNYFVRHQICTCTHKVHTSVDAGGIVGGEPSRASCRVVHSSNA